MTRATTTPPPPTRIPPEGLARPSRRRPRSGISLPAYGEPMVWFTGGALAVSLVMIIGLLTLIVRQGAATFWTNDLLQVQTIDGRTLLGEVTRDDAYRLTPQTVANMSSTIADAARPLMEQKVKVDRHLLRTGNFEVTGTHFHWVSDFEIAEQSRPEWALLLERVEWGRFYGLPVGFTLEGERIATEPQEVWQAYQQYHSEVRRRWQKRRNLETDSAGEVNVQLEKARLALRSVELEHGEDSPQYAQAQETFDAVKAEADERLAEIREQIDKLNEENDKYVLEMKTADGEERSVLLADIVRAVPANRLGFWGKMKVYASRWWEFVSDEPREANSEGGVFPAIFGTVLMTMIMSVLVVPVGVLAALYLREYAKAGPVVSAVRISINNLAGVPSIVFGVFGLGFFCYIVGANIDQVLFAESLPTPTFGKGALIWASFTLALLTLPVVIVATEEALAAVPNSMREGSYACGASKWQTIYRIVLPRAMPGIMTGTILAMARGAGEVAPLMLVGVIKWAPELPFALTPPFGLNNSFMHLGFHVYDLGFQSQNSEAAKPMVYTTTLLLIAIIAVLNLAAIWLRTRLRRKFLSSQF